MYIANNMTCWCGTWTWGILYAFHFMAILKRIKRENDDSSVGHGHSGSFGVAYWDNTHTHTHAGKLLTKHLAPFVASSKNCTWLRSNAMICHVYSCKIKTSLFWLWFATLLHVKSNWCGFYALNDGAWPFLEPAAGHICSKFQTQEIHTHHTPSHESLPQHALPHESLPEGFYQFPSISISFSEHFYQKRLQTSLRRPFAGFMDRLHLQWVGPQLQDYYDVIFEGYASAMPSPQELRSRVTWHGLVTFLAKGSGWGIQISY